MRYYLPFSEIDCREGQFFSASRLQKVSKNFSGKKLTITESFFRIDISRREDLPKKN